jgi:Arc/MetJ-type ribon-helix-helix transcriptional regulator
MPRRGYKSLVIPEVLMQRIQQYIEESQGRYISISEVVRAAVWAFLQKQGKASRINNGEKDDA